MGVGTPYVESLTSYLLRLAEVHNVRPSSLVKFCIAHVYEDRNVPPVQNLSRIDGVSGSSCDWLEGLITLTGQIDIQFTNMYRWHSLIGKRGLLRLESAWCEICLQEWDEAGQRLYEPLIWRLQAVEICPIHQTSLTTKCHICQQSFLSTTSRRMAGYCPVCHALLGCQSNGVDCATPIQVSRIQYIKAVLTQQKTDNIEKIVNHFSDIITHLKGIKNNREWAKRLNVGLGSLTNLIAGNQPPNLETLISLLEVLDQHNAITTDLKLRLPESSVEETTNIPVKRLSKIEQEAYLNSILNSEDDVPNLLEVAAQCGYQYMTELKAAHYKLFNKLATKKRKNIGEYLRDILANEDDLNLPSFEEITDMYGVSSLYVRKYFPDEYAEFLRRREVTFQNELGRIRNTLDEELKYKRGNSIRAISDQVGWSPGFLKKHFPELVRQIIEQNRAKQNADTEERLERIYQTVVILHNSGEYPNIRKVRDRAKTTIHRGRRDYEAYAKAIHDCGYDIDD